MADIDTAELENELARLLADERDALLGESLVKLLVKVYGTIGSLPRLSQIVVLAAEIRAAKKLNAQDLPGPDAVWRPLILGIVRDNAAELMSDILANKTLL